MTSPKSIESKLKQIAKKQNTTFNDVLVSFGLERAIYRISISKYSSRFTLKGGVLLYALFEGEYVRATTDIDLLASNISNDIEQAKKVFSEIFSLPCEDCIVFDINSLKMNHITEMDKYSGVNVFLWAYLGHIRIPVSIDIGFGDIIFPERQMINFPVLLSMEEPKLYAYSIYSILAEKFEAMVSLGLANSRYKDFYDIFIISTEYSLKGEILKEAVEKTFFQRHTSFDDIVVFEQSFYCDPIHEKRWGYFIDKKKAIKKIDFLQVVDRVRSMMQPVVESIKNNTAFKDSWNNRVERWE